LLNSNASPSVFEILDHNRIWVITLICDVIGHVTILFPVGHFLFSSSISFS